jgi:hypothetical protein
MANDRHMGSPVNSEYGLCGVAWDGENGDEDHAFAEAGDLVTCVDCRAVIDACKAIVRYRLPRD